MIDQAGNEMFWHAKKTGGRRRRYMRPGESLDSPIARLLLCCASLLVGASAVRGQETEAAGSKEGGIAPGPGKASRAETGCRQCHTCDNPTPEEKCLLHPCTRRDLHQRAAHFDGLSGPDVVILDELENAYLPVPFDHRGHARMAEMAGGCVTCHHYTPEGWRHPACKTCHDPKSAGTDIRKPGLKGAYHQQCLNCHREWIDETDCAICHRTKAGRSRESGQAKAPTSDDILGRMHPPIPEPEGDLYRGNGVQQPETAVVFRHEEHVRRFGLNCVDCHHESSCVRCHGRAEEAPQVRTLAGHHRPCVWCHKDDMNLDARDAGRCEGCHWIEGQPEPKRFEHSSTGWPLKAYHRNTNCRACHTQVPFVELERDCRACHQDWDPTSFDHGVTGQVLDDTHAEIDCEECHRDQRFDQPPACDECHEEEDGVAFPAKRPGPPERDSLPTTESPDSPARD